MRTTKLYKIFIVCFFCAVALLFVKAYAQKGNFEWQATIKPVPQNGFYHLSLSPSIIGLSAQPQMGDIRIFQDQQEIPYFIRENEPQAASSFDTLTVLSYRQYDHPKHSELIVGNTNKKQLNQLLVFMNNASTDKDMQLSGSYDQKKWYAVRETFPLSNTIVRSTGTEMVALLQLPATSYAYYKLSISDSLSAPLYITKVGLDTLPSKKENPYLDQLPEARLKQVKARQASTSLWQLSYDQAMLIQQLNLEVSSPKLFRREITVLSKEVYRDRRGRNKEDYVVVGRGVLLPDQSVLTLDNEVKAKQLYIEVNDEDNVPLNFQKITGWQRRYDLITYLEMGKEYRFVFGNPTIAAPHYDLSYFAHTIQDQTPPLTLETFQRLKQPTTEEPRVFKTVYWFWAGLVLVLTLLLWMSNNLLKEMKRKKGA
ncbi:hypothetical protein GCM10023231_10120 [Olivibacter ginsenosidimutans]|uniref:DUF3999 domain-containing protein n=2 Tax=Olivibacter ginsenosidimutans TaxID=1176537 RepID=A0ABP9AQU7_9SPHI